MANLTHKESTIYSYNKYFAIQQHFKNICTTFRTTSNNNFVTFIEFNFNSTRAQSAADNPISEITHGCYIINAHCIILTKHNKTKTLYILKSCYITRPLRQYMFRSLHWVCGYYFVAQTCYTFRRISHQKL